MEKIFLAKIHGVFAAPLLIQEPRQVKNDGKLGKLRGLDSHRAKTNPTMRGVRTVQEEPADQHQQNTAKHGVNHGGLAELVIVRAHQNEHSEKTDQKPGRLPHEENIRMTVQLFRGDGGSAQNHHGAKEAKGKRHAKEPAVTVGPSRHVAHRPREVVLAAWRSS